MKHPDFKHIYSYLMMLQDKICLILNKIDNTSIFHENVWQYPSGGQGRIRVLNYGNIFEQIGVSVSWIHGSNMPASATICRPQLIGSSYQAIGLSLIIHPKNPYIPTTHANIRCLISQGHNHEEPIWWFGGGFDLTPFYGFYEDVIHWHRIAKNICLPFGADLYPKYKNWCDNYFFLTHRNEARGVGGIFFDDLTTPNFSQAFAFTRAVGDGFLDAYLPIVEKRKSYLWGERERQFQLYRRGRYVEFNLILDRGTLFGLQTGGRIESILMSMPPLVRWEYDYQPSLGSPEWELYRYFLPIRDWLQD